jgi:hypothetical protein
MDAGTDKDKERKNKKGKWTGVMRPLISSYVDVLNVYSK